MTTAIGDAVMITKTRTTGATVVVERCGEGHWLDDQPGWVCLCLPHSVSLHCATRLLAEAQAPAVFGWCEECGAIERGESPKIVDAYELVAVGEDDA